MDDTDILPIGFLIEAQIRRAAQEGIPIVVRQRGDDSVGAVLLKINRLDGTADILIQARYEDERVWNPLRREGPMSEAEAERYLTRQAEIDPDLWLLEIEDKQGRHWFPGRVIKN